VSEMRITGCVLVLLAVAGLLVVGGSAAGRAVAQSAWPYDLGWNTVDGGGGTFSSGGAYRLGGTIGQADAGLMVGGGYGLAGGFWGRGWSPFRLYLPLAVRTWP
jgi:hypothetical protein